MKIKDREIYMYENELKKAIQEYKRGNLNNAQTILKKIVANDMQNEKAWYVLAKLSKDNKEKIKCLNHIIEINPNNKYALDLLQKLYKLYNIDSKVSKDNFYIPERGEVTFKEIRQLIINNKISPSTKIYSGRLLQWFEAADDVRLKRQFKCHPKYKTEMRNQCNSSNNNSKSFKKVNYLIFCLIFICLLFFYLHHSNYFDRKWTFTTEGYMYLPSIGPDKTIYVSAGGYIYALLPNGKLKWKTKISEGVSTPVISKNNIIYVYSFNNKIYKLDSNGKIKGLYSFRSHIWETTFLGIKPRTPSIGNNNLIIFADRCSLFALDPNDDGFKDIDKYSESMPFYGYKKWVYRDIKCDKWNEYPIAISNNGNIYACSNVRQDTLFKFDSNGQLLWKYDKFYGRIESSPVIDFNGVVYVGTDYNKLHAISPDAKSKWVFNTEDDIVCSPVIDNDGNIYVCTADGILYSINKHGNQKWSIKIDNFYRHNASIAIGNNNNIYVSTTKGVHVYNFNGKHIKLFRVWNQCGRPIISTDGTLYVTTRNKIIAFNTESNGLANSPWPMFKQNIRHTGKLEVP